MTILSEVTLRPSDNRSEAILNVLPLPVIVVGSDDRIVEANLAAQSFFQMSRSVLRRHRLAEIVPFGSPLLSLIEQVRANGGSVSEYRVDIGTPRIGTDKIVDLYATLEADDAHDVVIMLQEKTIAEKMDRQLTHRGAARSISAMGSMLAHEIKNPSLPPVWCNKDQLIQVFLNLVKNAAEAIGPDAVDGEIEISTAYRAGVRMVVPGTNSRVALPLEICIRDNGPGVPEDLMRSLFDPFISTKASGTGLGLALVSKIIGDHGGVVECESLPRRTIFRVLLSMQTPRGSNVRESDG